MGFKIVRGDITKMDTEAIVNTANAYPCVGKGCDSAVYQAAGYAQLLTYRAEQIGFVPEGNVFLTPGFQLRARYIIHAVSPLYIDGKQEEEKKLRSCYRKSLKLADEYRIRSIAFPLISTGSFAYPKEEGMRIAVDEIQAFLRSHEMDVFLVVFDGQGASSGRRIYPDLNRYLERKYAPAEYVSENRKKRSWFSASLKRHEPADLSLSEETAPSAPRASSSRYSIEEEWEEASFDFENRHVRQLEERMRHLSDTFSQYLMYLIKEKHMENTEVYKRAIVDKKIFSKIKSNINYHPQKLTALCLCIGAKLNLDEARDLLARAGYALSPCDKTDIIFSYFIENQIYDMIELDIQLEEHGLPCIII